MSIKYVLGIILPLIIAGLLIAISASPGGLTITEETTGAIEIASLTSQNYDTNKKLFLKRIEVHNNKLLSQKFEISNYIACLVDKENFKKKINLNLVYSVHPSLHEDVPVFNDLTTSLLNSKRYVELSSKEKKKIEIFAEQVVLRRNQQINEYSGYDYIMLAKADSFMGCNRLDDENLKDVETISLSSVTLVCRSLGQGCSTNEDCCSNACLQKNSGSKICSEPPMIDGDKTCIDTHNGKAIFEKGEVIALVTSTVARNNDPVEELSYYSQQEDRCQSNPTAVFPTNLYEYYCLNGDYASGLIPCEFGCKDGACLTKEESEKMVGRCEVAPTKDFNACSLCCLEYGTRRSAFTINQYCGCVLHETDCTSKTNDKYMKGTLTYKGAELEDYCHGNQLVEYACYEGEFSYSYINCEQGCENGACL